MQLNSASNLVFTWLGSPIPAYAKKSIKLNLLYARSRIYIITDVDNIERILHTWPAKLVSRITLLNASEFYSPPQYLDRIQYFGSKDFRSGFWLRTFERFFLLNAFLASQRLDSFFHAELDNICFNLCELQSLLDAQPANAFFVRDNLHRAVLSLAYFSSATALDQLIAYILSLPEDHRFNDMHDLGQFLCAEPAGVSILPNESALLSSPLWDCLNPNQIGGICDGNSLGQYLLGLDPLISSNLLNLFRNENLYFPLEKAKFCHVRLKSQNYPQFTFQQFPGLQVDPSIKPVTIYNLHIHSKDFFWLSNLFLQRILFMLVNNSIPLPVFTPASLVFRIKRAVRNKISLFQK